MALVHLAKIALVLVLICGVATARPIPKKVETDPDGEGFSQEKHSDVEVAEPTSEESFPSRLRAGGLAVLGETGKILRTAAMLPAEALQLIRMLTVPVLDATLSVPANVLEGAASMSMKGLRGAEAGARTSTSAVLSLLANLKDIKHHLLPHIAFEKNITIGPISLHKTFELGAPPKSLVTPAPEVHPEVTPPPAVVAAVTAPPAVAVVPPPIPTAVVPVVVAPAVVAPPDGSQVQIATVVHDDPEA